MYCSSLNRISKLSAYCSILYLSDFFYYNICTLRYLNIIYTMNYFSCIWRSPGHFTDSKCWRFSWLFIFVEIVDLNFIIQLNYTYCQEERCFTIHATPLTNLKYNSLNLRSIYWTAINHIYYCHYLSENETLKKKSFLSGEIWTDWKYKKIFHHSVELLPFKNSTWVSSLHANVKSLFSWQTRLVLKC